MKKVERKEQDENKISASAMQGGHNNTNSETIIIIFIVSNGDDAGNTIENSSVFSLIRMR